MEKNIAENLVWIDLEMTGLNPDKDVILEIATVITNSLLEVIAQGPSLVIHQPDEILLQMNEIVKEMHAKSGLTQKVRASKITLGEAQEETLDFIKQYCEPGFSPLCGNSVYMDRMFIRKYMPEIHNYLYYRLIDVTSIKELALRWYPNEPEFEKKETHRALEDIYESIDELRFYKDKFFRKV